MRGKQRLIDRETAETVAIQGLAFLAEEPARLQRFLAATGLEAADIRALAETPALMSAVLELLAADESLLLVFAASRGIGPDSIGRAIRMLQVPQP